MNSGIGRGASGAIEHGKREVTIASFHSPWKPSRLISIATVLRGITGDPTEKAAPEVFA